MVVQSQMQLGTPWIFPYMVAVSAFALSFLVLILVLIARHTLLPEIIVVGSFILCVLWFTGLVGTSIQLYGNKTNVNSNCQNYVINQQFKGASINTLAWLTQINICNCWKTAFAFEVINTVFFLWMILISYKVYQQTDDDY
jgi:magnesium-transporting ATPase (P-type)